MISSEVHSSGAKLEMALKTFHTTWEAVSPQWSDAASRSFEETHLSQVAPQVKEVVAAIAHLAAVFAAAERQCGPEEQ